MKYAVILLFITSYALAVPMPEKERFYVYQDAHSQLNHFIPSGFMGDWQDLHFDPAWKLNPASGTTCIKITYTAERKQNAGWAGIYFQYPAMNWGTIKVKGYNLSKYKKLRFMVRGEHGREYIDKFGMGGITSQSADGDSGSSSTEAIELTKDWKEYEIDLKDVDLTNIIGGFLFAANADMNQNGFVMYLDEIRYVE